MRSLKPNRAEKGLSLVTSSPTKGTKPLPGKSFAVACLTLEIQDCRFSRRLGQKPGTAGEERGFQFSYCCDRVWLAMEQVGTTLTAPRVYLPPLGQAGMTLPFK